MAKKLGSASNSAVVLMQTPRKADEVLSICNRHEWEVIVGVDPGKPENIADLEKLLNPPTPSRHPVKVGRNEPCPCGSGLKYKKCCGTGLRAKIASHYERSNT